MVNQDLVVQLTDERRALNRVLQILKEADIREFGPLIELYVQMAFMWLGKAKRAVGSETPYPASTDPTSKIIEPAVDLFEGSIEDVNAIIEDDIAIVKQMRLELERVAKQIRSGLSLSTDNAAYIDCVREAWVNAENAKMWLGMALGSIRNNMERKEAAGDSTMHLNQPPGGPPAPSDTGAGTPPPAPATSDLQSNQGNDAATGTGTQA